MKVKPESGAFPRRTERFPDSATLHPGYVPDKGVVFVIHDRKSHDQIIEEITSRRQKQLLTWYGEINFDNDLEKEIAKFRWLAEQKVLPAEQADQIIAQAQAAFHAKGNTPSITLNYCLTPRSSETAQKLRIWVPFASLRRPLTSTLERS